MEFREAAAGNALLVKLLAASGAGRFETIRDAVKAMFPSFPEFFVFHAE